MKDQADARFGRLLLYVLIHQNKAIDWDARSVRIGFDGKELLEGFEPQFHHIFPKKFLGKAVDQSDIDALANIAIIGPSINIRISKQDPMDYIPKYKITAVKLKQQFISGQIRNTTVQQYPKWVRSRAADLSRTANKFLEDLRGNLKLPLAVPAEEERAYDAA